MFIKITNRKKDWDELHIKLMWILVGKRLSCDSPLNSCLVLWFQGRKRIFKMDVKKKGLLIQCKSLLRQEKAKNKSILLI